MSIEYEYRFININEPAIKNLLKKNGGKKIQSKTLMKIIVYNHPQNKTDIYIRLRNEGKHNTMTVKTKNKLDNSEFPFENEIIVDNISIADNILQILGCTVKYIVEKIREVWYIKGAKEIVFDSYPGVPTYIEIDALNEIELVNICNKLKLNINDRWITDDIYNYFYGVPKNRKMGSLTFNTASDMFENLINKNKKLFKHTLRLQIKFIKDKIK